MSYCTWIIWIRVLLSAPVEALSPPFQTLGAEGNIPPEQHQDYPSKTPASPALPGRVLLAVLCSSECILGFQIGILAFPTSSPNLFLQLSISLCANNFLLFPPFCLNANHTYLCSEQIMLHQIASPLPIPLSLVGSFHTVSLIPSILSA